MPTRPRRWLAPDRPDPDGFHLQSVAAIAAAYLDDTAAGSATAHSPLAAAFARHGLGRVDFALFWDFASLFQRPRSAAEDVAFRRGLRASNIWYGHSETVCWMQTRLPNNASAVTSYDASGWVRAQPPSPLMRANAPPPAAFALSGHGHTVGCLWARAADGRRVAPA